MTLHDLERHVRERAHEIMRICGEGARDDTELVSRLLPALKRVLDKDLRPLGVKREANHIKNSKWLYYDGLLTMTLDEYPKGQSVAAHDHGVWEALLAVSGAFRHTVYRRLDDGSREGYAELEAIDDRVLRPGDIGIVAQPAEIHSFEAVEDNTYSIAVVGGHYKEVRHYFDPEKKTCVVRRPRAL